MSNYSNTSTSLTQLSAPFPAPTPAATGLVNCQFTTQTIRVDPLTYNSDDPNSMQPPPSDISATPTLQVPYANITGNDELVQAQSQPRLDYSEMSQGVKAGSQEQIERLGFNSLINSRRGSEFFDPINEGWTAAKYQHDLKSGAVQKQNAEKYMNGLNSVTAVDAWKDFHDWVGQPAVVGAGPNALSTAVFSALQQNALVHDFIRTPPCSWWYYFEQLDSSATHNVTTSPLFMIIMGLCRSQVLYGMAFTGETRRDSPTPCAHKNLPWRIAIMGLLSTISDSTKVSDVMDLLYDPQSTSSSPSNVFGSLPILPPIQSGIYGGRNDQIILAYDAARKNNSGCPAVAGTIALMDKCPSWNQETNCIKTASKAPVAISWGNGIRIFESLVGKDYYDSVFKPAYDAANPDNVGQGEPTLMTTIRDNVEIFVPGVPGAFSLRCAQIAQESSDPECIIPSGVTLCGSAAGAARAISSWIYSAIPTLSPANRIGLYNQLLSFGPDTITGARSSVGLAISSPGMKRITSTVVSIAAYGEELQSDETRTISRSYEVIAHDDPNRLVARADLSLNLKLYCREESVPASDGVIATLSEKVRNLANPTDTINNDDADAVTDAICLCITTAPAPVCGVANPDAC